MHLDFFKFFSKALVGLRTTFCNKKYQGPLKRSFEKYQIFNPIDSFVFLPSFVHFSDEGRSFALLDQPMIRLSVGPAVISPEIKNVFVLIVFPLFGQSSVKITFQSNIFIA